MTESSEMKSVPHITFTRSAMVSENLAVKYAERLIDKFRFTDPPTDLEKIAKSMEVKIVKEDLDGDGYTIKMPNGKGLVLCKNYGDETNFRWRFTLAHEIGHWTLDRLLEHEIHQKEETSNEKVEKWCDKFAISLLVPKSWFLKLAEEHLSKGTLSYESIISLSRQFKVSEQIIRFCLWDYEKIATIDVEVTESQKIRPKNNGYSVPDFLNFYETAKFHQKEIVESLNFVRNLPGKKTMGPFVRNGVKSKEAIMFII